MTTKVIPPLGDQLENLRCYVLEREKWEERLDHIIGAPLIDAPRCEMKTSPAKIAHWEDPAIPASSAVPNCMDGTEMVDCRYCPHCRTFMWWRGAIGSIVNCWFCGGTMTW